MEAALDNLGNTQSLWLAVIRQCLKDALMSNWKPSSETSSIEVDEARRWFSEGSRDFRLVCDFAGLDPDWVRRKALEEMALGSNTFRLGNGYTVKKVNIN